LFLLIFWSQAILHAVSFIRWPLRIGHMFLYFVAAFTQVIAYSNLTDPVRWFFWGTIFGLVVALLYSLDLLLIRDMRSSFGSRAGGNEFLSIVEKRHRYEFKTLVPLSIGFNLALYLLLLYVPYFSNLKWYVIFGMLEVLVCAVSLSDSVRNFNKRTKLISEYIFSSEN